jgi:dipeptidyl aminopeptidase/acylaminoacyl peptidase
LPARSYHSLRLSPDGRRAAVAALEAGRHVLRLVDLERGTEGLLEMPGSNWSPIWHPAGDRLAFLTLRKGDFDVYWRDLPEGTPEEPLLEADSDESPHDFSSSGSHLVFEESTAGGRYEVRTLELAASGERQSLFPAEAEVAISPDERWLAYGDEQVSVRPFLRPGATIRVSRGHGTSPVWSRTESLLLYRRGDEIVAAPYREEGGRLVVGDERLVARVPGIARSPRTFDLAPDGRILALVQVDPDAKPELRVVLGWDREVTALAPPDPER